MGAIATWTATACLVPEVLALFGPVTETLSAPIEVEPIRSVCAQNDAQ